MSAVVLLVEHELLLVTAEAERVALLGERRVERGRILLHEHAEMVAAVDLMTRGAVALRDRSVRVRAGVDHRLDVGDLPAVRQIELAVVALEAERRHVRREDARVIARVRIVAIQALPIGRHRRVLRARGLHRVADRLVAGEAERLRIVAKQHAVVRRVGIVARLAVVARGGVHDAPGAELGLDARVAVDAELRRRRDQQPGVGRGMGQMADRARPDRDGAVHVLTDAHPVAVTVPAQRVDRRRFQDLGVRPAVRIVAPEAVAALGERRVHDGRPRRSTS